MTQLPLFGSESEAEAIAEARHSLVRDQVVRLLTSPENSVSVDTQRGHEAGVPEHGVDSSKSEG